MKVLHEGHRDRMRARLAADDAVFADHELLEILLYYAIPRKDTNRLAHEILIHFGSLEGIMTASVEELAELKGIGKNAASLFRLIALISKRLYNGGKKSVFVKTPADAAVYVLEKLRDKRNECFAVLAMDIRGRVLKFEIITEGTIDNVPLYLRSVASTALALNASNIILAHNHPTGEAFPSRKDIDVTTKLVENLMPLGIHVSDHMIVANNEVYSFFCHQKDGSCCDMEQLAAAQYAKS